MRFQFRAVSLFFALSIAVSVQGQAPASGTQPGASPSSVVPPSGIVQSALAEVQSSTSALNISRWKAPSEVREQAQENVDSIQRDLGNTLPGLLTQADAAPGSVPPTFAVYRNVDALYDVLLRVSETADLAAPSSEAASVASALQKLESARSQLGDAIMQTSQRHEAQIVALQAAAKKAPVAAAAGKTDTVVDDGPAKTSTSTKKKTAQKKPASKPPAGTPATNPSN
jgi:hypothetical protein